MKNRLHPFKLFGRNPNTSDRFSLSLFNNCSGKTLQVPAGSSLLDVLLNAGVPHDDSCREGVCGAYETKVLADEVDHQDSILTKAERKANKTMMVCVSGCKRGLLVLDI